MDAKSLELAKIHTDKNVLDMLMRVVTGRTWVLLDKVGMKAVKLGLSA